MNRISALLAGKPGKSGIEEIVAWATQSLDNKQLLVRYAFSVDDRVGVNALWALSHFPKSEAEWLQSLQNSLIDRLLVETHPSKKRILLQILREQNYEKSAIRADFIDYCFSKINSCCEPYAVRAFSLYCAFKMCCFYSELIAELDGYLDMLPSQDLSPGLLCALRTTRKNIAKLSKQK